MYRQSILADSATGPLRESVRVWPST